MTRDPERLADEQARAQAHAVRDPRAETGRRDGGNLDVPVEQRPQLRVDRRLARRAQRDDRDPISRSERGDEMPDRPAPAVAAVEARREGREEEDASPHAGLIGIRRSRAEWSGLLAARLTNGS
jgi:hypothetical protein